MQSSEREFLFKVLLVGDPGVGKSSILSNYIKRDFKTDYTVTIGVEFGSKIIELDQDTKIKLQIWDTAGQESFRSIVKSFYRNTSGVYLCYSVTRRDSFENLETWFSEVRDNTSSNVVITLVGNQSDKNTERAVTYEEGEKFAKDNNIDLFYETSAFRGDNIDKCFFEGTKMVFQTYINDQNSRKSNLLQGDADGPSMNLVNNRNTRLSTRQLVQPNSEESRPKSGCC